MTETTPSASPEAAIVAQSLSTVGYAMFSLTRPGPVEAVESFSVVVQRGGTFISTPVVVAGVDDVYDDANEENSAFGAADVDENMGAVAPVAVADDASGQPFVPPVLGAEHVGATSALMAIGPDGRPVGMDQPGATARPAAPAAPAAPVPALPEYHSNGQSLQVLQDINFLDD